MNSPTVEVKNVTRVFSSGDRETSVLDNLTLEIKQGTFASVVGKSGSGKSTLLNLIAGIDLPDSGVVTLAGRRISDCPERERTKIRRRNVGIVFQFFNLVPTLTARENIRFPLELLGRSETDRVEELLFRLGLEQRADRYPSSLSGGEQQRVAIARALVHSPKVVLADEPTGNLDYENSQNVLESFRELCRDQDVTVLMATHSRDCAEISERTYELRSGELYEE
ncbi:MAG: ABC transporter ATP-binding protein [bacterium]